MLAKISLFISIGLLLSLMTMLAGCQEKNGISAKESQQAVVEAQVNEPVLASDPSIPCPSLNGSPGGSASTGSGGSVSGLFFKQVVGLELDYTLK